MKIKKEQSTMIRIFITALLAALIALNNHWSITIGFIFIMLTLEIQGKIVLDILQDVIKIIGKVEKLEEKESDANLGKD